MKKQIVSFLIIGLMVLKFSSNTNAQENKPSWPEMKAFHGVMSETFHPSEEGKLEPIKSRSGEMLAKAEAWSKSKAPKEFDKPAVKETLAILVKEAKSLDELVKKKAGDAELTKALFDLHERFHSVVGACNAGDGNDKNEHNHGEHGDHGDHKH